MSNQEKVNNILQNSDLKDKQKQAIKLLLDYEKDMTQEEIASSVGISRTTLYDWRKFNEEFKRVKSKLVDETIAEYLDQADKSLIKKVNEGSVRAIELYYKRIGKLVDKKEVEHKGGLDITQLHEMAKDADSE